MKVLIAGGGTGGHLFPGIAVAEELKARGHEVRFVGTARGIEARIVPTEGWPLDLIDVAGIKGGGVLGLLRGLFRLPHALWQSRRLLRRERPDLVIGVGGYASGPVVLAAALHGRPTAILEQNSVPGITNRMLGRVVRRVFGAFTAAAAFFPAKKFRLLGNPIRRKVRESLSTPRPEPKPEPKRKPSPSPTPSSVPQLLVVGGSQGAHAVNELMVSAMKVLASRGRAPALHHQTGPADRELIAKAYADAGIAAQVSAFIDDMASAYRAATLAVTRAGASTLAELTVLGVPALLIPFPHAADDHQTVNARELEAQGAARVLLQKDTTPEMLADAIAQLLDDEAARRRMAEAARALGRPDAHAAICDEILGLVPPERALSAPAKSG